MLQNLAIRDVVLIDHLDLAIEPGLTVLTGETGAGKSIVLDALGLALGSRGDSGLVRKGAAHASVSAAFDLPARHPAHALLAERGLEAAQPLIVRRMLGADGRGRAFVNDQPVSIGLLRELGDLLVEVHGQFDAHGLLDPATHRAALDAQAGLEDQAAAARERHAAWKAAAETEAAARTAAEQARRDEDFLRHAVSELEALAPRPGEESELAQRRALLSAREKVVEALNAAAVELGAQKGVAGALRAAQRLLERISVQAFGKLDPAIAALERAAVETTEAVAQVEAAGAAFDLDTSALERTEERLFALRALARKHRVEVDALADLAAAMSTRLAALDDGAAALKRLAAATAAARAGYAAAAQALTRARTEAAAGLDRDIARELPPLKLEKARFRTRIDKLPEESWGPTGADRVAFEVATNPGLDPGPIAKIASGGELARFMLALKVVLARSGRAPTLVFDEVDSGIGGAAAAAVGERLARLAERMQVLVVTHSPQVAARGRQHWRVAKRNVAGGTLTRVETLDAEARREEIARLLSGAQITDAARVAADSLIAAGSPLPVPRRAARSRA